MCNSCPAFPHLDPLNPLWCAVAYTVGLPLPLPQTSHRVFPSDLTVCNRPDVWNVTRTSQRYLFLEEEGRSSVLRAGNGRHLFYLKRGGKKWVLTYFSLSSEDLTEALLESTAALTYLEMLPPFPLSWQLVGLKTQYMQSLCDKFEGPRAKGPQETISKTPAALQHAVSSPKCHPLPYF